MKKVLNTSKTPPKSASGKPLTSMPADQANIESAKAFLDTIPAAMRMVRAEMRKIAGSEFSIPQYRVLFKVWRQPSSNQELAEWLGVKAPTMSRMIDSLVKQGFARREASPNPKDRRVIRIEATHLGVSKVKRMRMSAEKTFATRLSKLSSSEKKILLEGLSLIRTHLIKPTDVTK